ncbi:hypothetical protein D5085_10615 [Ectothiorhodospiraceae bacterium BW-2]|nr:hypothetical protein D5085_10615 [Ectothiorhodospiraceae bacterium BW-2]
MKQSKIKVLTQDLTPMLLRHLCLGLLDQDASVKGSLAKKIRKAGWNDRYRAKVVFGGDL